MKWLQIVLLCILAAVLFGVIHDQVTARICVEYFTIGHRDIGTDNPTIIGLYWGVIATWWVGAGLGILLATAARAGNWPKREPVTLFRPLIILMSVAGALAVVAGFAGWIAASNEWVFLVEPIASRVPQDRHVPFLTDLWMHLASYAVAGLGGITLMVLVLLGRQREHFETR
jgi:hypothetical protein